MEPMQSTPWCSPLWLCASASVVAGAAANATATVLLQGTRLNSVYHYHPLPQHYHALPPITTHYPPITHPLPPITHPLPPITPALPPITSVLPAYRTPAGGRFFWVAAWEGRRPGGAAARGA
jgi:hypothetical protein